MAALPILIGERFGKLVVVAEVSRTKGHRTFRCSCDCGGSKDVYAARLAHGVTKSCGCLLRNKNPKGNPNLTRRSHGERRCADGKPSPEYVCWDHIIDRCCNPKSKDFKNYGGRGITVCERWRKSYPAFLADVGRKPTPEHTIDRKDNNGNYEPSNVRWATRDVQNNNRRPAGRH